MKKLIDEIHTRAKLLKFEYCQQCNGSKAENKELLKLKVDRLTESLEKLKEDLK